MTWSNNTDCRSSYLLVESLLTSCWGPSDLRGWYTIKDVVLLVERQPPPSMLMNISHPYNSVLRSNNQASLLGIFDVFIDFYSKTHHVAFSLRLDYRSSSLVQLFVPKMYLGCVGRKTGILLHDSASQYAADTTKPIRRLWIKWAITLVSLSSS